MKSFLTATFSLLVLVSTPAFSQSSNATIGGTIDDSTGAILPGVAVTATNGLTGVVTTVFSNEAGTYNFASLISGVYT